MKAPDENRPHLPESIRFASQGIDLEGWLVPGNGRRAAVITHPHPLYGGDMANPVVAAAARAAHRMGLGSLRFNFRGVGASDGCHDNGRGEQRDVAAAVDWLRTKGYTQVVLVGYSFGAWVNAQAAGQLEPDGEQILISPPVAFLDHGGVGAIPGLRLVATGECDGFAPVHTITRLMPVWSRHARLEVIAGADHFYSGHLERLEGLIAGAL